MSNTNQSERMGWSVTEWGQLYGFSRAFSYQLVKDGRVRKINVGRRSIITKEANEAFRAALNSTEAA